MNSMDREVLTTVDGWLDAGFGCQLVTVVQTWGSSPRAQGAMMAIRADGVVVGSVSGGCIEDDLIARAREGGFAAAPELLTYGVEAGDAHRFGLPCGGTIRLACEPLSGASGIKDVLARLERKHMVARSVHLASGRVEICEAAPEQGLALQDGVLTNTFGPRWRLLVIGAGPLSQFLAQVAVGLDYHVIVCDPREEVRAGWNVAGVEVVHAMPDDLVLALKLDRRSAVVALTHDPKLDDLALMEALRSDAFYVGAIGSRLNTARRRERLLQFDVSAAQLDRLHAPIGLYIGSKTPPEIAISILAQLTAVRNGLGVPPAQP
ncbi:XdhC family protein [Massilia sp. TSP1-1-2]|uniref:XdhC family protein n=1 Tax=unclassified Massilia TaxID=2609279 RepID=UPI003CF88846